MQDGASRSDAPYVWPETIQRSDAATLVYLDLNHWIGLSKAHAGHPDGDRYGDALQVCREAVRTGRIVFPISTSTVIEASKIRSHRQRLGLRRIIEDVSTYLFLVSRTTLIRHEVEAVLDQLIGPRTNSVPSVPYLQTGVMGAFGVQGGLKVDRRDANGELSEDLRQTLDAMAEMAEEDLNRFSIEGPSPQERPGLRWHGWDPHAAHEIAARRAQQEAEQVKRFDGDPRWRRGRIRDVIAAREILLELDEPLQNGLAARSAEFSEVFPDRIAIRSLLDPMPSLDVAITIKTSYHRDSRHKWTANDIFDVDAMSTTLPHCDMVLTDAAVASQITRSGLDTRLNTVVSSDISALIDA